MEGEFLDVRLEAFLEQLSSGGRAPGGGSAAALTVALAARLVVMVARCSEPVWREAGGIAAQADAVGDRAAELVDTDARVWDDALAALREAEAGSGDDPERNRSLERKLELAAAVPIEIASLGADVTSLAALAAESGDAGYRADAATAAALAAGAARAATHLVRVNLGVRTDDPRLARALASEQAASDVASRLFEAPR